MDEQVLPKNYFNLSDGKYCFVLPDRIIITPKLSNTTWPEPKEGPDTGSQILFGIIGTVCAVLSVLFFYVGFYPLAVMTTLACAGGFVSFYRGTKFSATPCIYRNTIEHCSYHKVNFAYDYFLLRYKSASGKIYLKRITVYDSAEIAAKAVSLFQAEGLLTNS